MTDLVLNERGLHFARSQYRVAEFVRMYADKSGFEVDVQSDNYVGPVLLKSDFLASFCASLGVKVEESRTDGEDAEECVFELFQEEYSPENKQNFRNCSLSLWKAASNTKNSEKIGEPDFEDYEAYVHWFAKLLQALQNLAQCIQMDLNSEHFLVEYTPSADEIKLCINLLGISIIAVNDVNHQLEQKVGIFSNGLWGVYLVNLINGFALEISNQNINYYAEFIGATALQTTNLTTYFNLVQLFTSVLLLWISDIIGRKPVYCFITLIYALTAGLLAGTPKFYDNYNDQIAYMSGMRALMGGAAIIAPLGFVVVADLAPPTIRSVATVMINAAAAVGAIFTFLLTIYLGSGKKYNTTNLIIGSQEYNEANTASFVDAHFWAFGAFLLGLLVCIFGLKESHPRILAARHLRKIGISAGRSGNSRASGSAEIAPDASALRSTPFFSVLREMCCNRDLVLLFFSYWINMIGASTSRTGAEIFIMRMYGFSDGNEAKTYVNIVMLVSIIASVLISTVGTKYVSKRLGEIRLIIISEISSTIESVVNFSVNPPIPKGFMFLTQICAAYTMLLCDAVFLELVSMYTKPQNRGSVLGIFQIGNSIGRTLSGVLTGVIYDYNLRNGQILNTLFAAISIMLLAVLRPPLQGPEMEGEAERMKQGQRIQNIV